MRKRGNEDGLKNKVIEEVMTKCPAFSGMRALWVKQLGFKYPNLGEEGCQEKLGLTEEFKQKYKTHE